MDNQHQKIKGYRDLTQGEIDLMNLIKVKGEELNELCQQASTHLVGQYRLATSLPASTAEENQAELDRITNANPARWVSIARTDFQTGLMVLTRAIAQPTSF